MNVTMTCDFGSSNAERTATTRRDKIQINGIFNRSPLSRRWTDSVWLTLWVRVQTLELNTKLVAGVKPAHAVPTVKISFVVEAMLKPSQIFSSFKTKWQTHELNKPSIRECLAGWIVDRRHCLCRYRCHSFCVYCLCSLAMVMASAQCLNRLYLTHSQIVQMPDDVNTWYDNAANHRAACDHLTGSTRSVSSKLLWALGEKERSKRTSQC